MRIEKEDLGDITICALRYALGRRTYVTAEVAEFITKNREKWSNRVLNVMKKDLNRYIEDRDNNLIHDDECDYMNWSNLLKIIEKELRKYDN